MILRQLLSGLSSHLVSYLASIEDLKDKEGSDQDLQ